jgi:hypothetical protein
MLVKIHGLVTTHRTGGENAGEVSDQVGARQLACVPSDEPLCWKNTIPLKFRICDSELACA